MGYTKNTWVNGDIITADKMNHMESGIYEVAEQADELETQMGNHKHSQYYDSTASRAANTVLAGPNGSAGAGTFRKLVAGDLGAICEYNTNSNGEYHKFADGTLICRKRHRVANTGIATADGSNFTSGSINTGTWPYTFSVVPVVNYSFVSDTDSVSAWIDGIFGISTTSSGSCYLAKSNSATVNGYVNVVGIGRWK